MVRWRQSLALVASRPAKVADFGTRSASGFPTLAARAHLTGAARPGVSPSTPAVHLTGAATLGVWPSIPIIQSSTSSFLRACNGLRSRIFFPPRLKCVYEYKLYRVKCVYEYKLYKYKSFRFPNITRNTEKKKSGTWAVRVPKASERGR